MHLRSFMRNSLFILMISPTAVLAQMTPGPNEVQVGPVSIQQPIQGINVTTVVTSYMSVSSSPAGLSVKARMFANLGDLQAKIGSIVDTFPLPRDNCGSYSANNPVVTIDTKKLTQSGDQIIFSVSGNVVMWDCRENPIRNSKFEWRNDGIFGTPSPTIVTWPGNPFKTILVTQPVDASIPISLVLLSPQTVQLKLGDPNIQLGGNPILSAVRDFLLNIFKVNINNMAANAINSSIDPNKLQATLPADFMRLGPKIVAAKFADVGGSAGAQVDAEALVVAANLTDILKAIADKGAAPH